MCHCSTVQNGVGQKKGGNWHLSFPFFLFLLSTLQHLKQKHITSSQMTCFQRAGNFYLSFLTCTWLMLSQSAWPSWSLKQQLLTKLFHLNSTFFLCEVSKKIPKTTKLSINLSCILCLVLKHANTLSYNGNDCKPPFKLALSLWACQHANDDAASMAVDSSYFLVKVPLKLSCSANFYKNPQRK